jgi:hypothetical protein
VKHHVPAPKAGAPSPPQGVQGAATVPPPPVRWAIPAAGVQPKIARAVPTQRREVPIPPVRWTNQEKISRSELPGVAQPLRPAAPIPPVRLPGMDGAVQPSMPSPRPGVPIPPVRWPKPEARRRPERPGAAQPLRATAPIPLERLPGALRGIQRHSMSRGEGHPATHTGQPPHPTQRQTSVLPNARVPGAAPGEKGRLNVLSTGALQWQTPSGTVIQRYQGQLLTQSGPSCWVFVVEAVADIYSRQYSVDTAFDTGLLAAVINLYPKHDVGDQRTLELQDIQRRIKMMIKSFTRMKGAFSHVSRDNIAKVVNRSVDRTNSPRVDDFLRIAFPQPGYYNIDEVNEFLERAAGLAGQLAVLVRNDPHNDAEGALLGSRGKTYIDEKSEDEDIALALKANLEKPAATMGVRYRLKPRNYPTHYDSGTDTYDLTGIPPSDLTEGGYHAILLVSVDGSSKTLVYKDPNYGNSKIKITFAQLRKMAESMSARNTGRGVEVQTFTGLQSGKAQIPAVLRSWGTIPTFSVFSAPPPPDIAPVKRYTPTLAILDDMG